MARPARRKRRRQPCRNQRWKLALAVHRHVNLALRDPCDSYTNLRLPKNEVCGKVTGAGSAPRGLYRIARMLLIINKIWRRGRDSNSRSVLITDNLLNSMHAPKWQNARKAVAKDATSTRGVGFLDRAIR